MMMLRATSVMLRRRIPKQFDHVAAPRNVAHWGKINKLNPMQREEIVHGEWRAATATPAPSSLSLRDGENAAAAEEEEEDTGNIRRAPSQKQPPPMVASESIPLTAVARDFHDQLARAADKALDPNAGIDEEEEDLVDGVDEEDDACEKQVQSFVTEAAAQEQRMAVHQQFFAQFYAEQQIVQDEAEGKLLVKRLQECGTTYFLIHPGLPLQRLVVRHQVETYLSRQSMGSSRRAFALVEFLDNCFTHRPEDPLAALLLGEKTTPCAFLPGGRVESATARLPPMESPEQQLEGASPGMTMTVTKDQQQEVPISADGLWAALTEEHAPNNDDSKGLEKTCEDQPMMAVDQLNDNVTDEEVEEEEKATRMVTVGELHWLQRQVASETVSACDYLSLVVSTIAQPRAGDITCVLGHASRVGSGGLGQVHFDVCQLLSFRVDCCGETLVPAPAVVHLRTADEELNDHDDDEATCLVRTSVENGAHALKGRCATVVCCPPSSADGFRPRPLLDGPAAKPADAPVNRFIDLCKDDLVALHKRQRWQLRQALGLVQEGGLVVYATHSMNPLENEAVVASVLTKEDGGRRGGGRFEVISLRDALGDAAGSHPWSIGTSHKLALTDWASVDVDVPSMRMESSSEAVRMQVGEKAARFVPSTCLEEGSSPSRGDREDLDGGFICVIRRKRSSSIDGEEQLHTHRPSSCLPLAASPPLREPLLLRALDPELIRRLEDFVILPSASAPAVLASSAASRLAHDIGRDTAPCGVAIVSRTGRLLTESLTGTQSGEILARALRVVRVCGLPLVQLLALLYLSPSVVPSTGLAAAARRQPQAWGPLVSAAEGALKDDGADEALVAFVVDSSMEDEDGQDGGTAAAAGFELHEMVRRELESVVVFATVRRSRKHKLWWNLIMFDDCRSSPGEKARWRSRQLATRDALVYCAAKLGQPSLRSDVFQHSGLREDDAAGAFVEHAAANHPNHDGTGGSPDDDEVEILRSGPQR